jgi:hypothetical protein
MIQPLCFYDQIIATRTFNPDRELRYRFAILPKDFLVQKENCIVINFDIVFVVIAMAYDKQAIVVMV